MGRGHDRELDMDMEYDSPPTSLMEAVSRAGTKISLGSSSTSTSTAVYDYTNDDSNNVGRPTSTMRSTLQNGKSAATQDSDFSMCGRLFACVNFITDVLQSSKLRAFPCMREP